jgi:hypothetical protein
LGSDAWYLQEIEIAYADPRLKGYERIDISPYRSSILRAYAEADYTYLGLRLEGAPDQNLIGETGPPDRLYFKPHWLFLDHKVVDYNTFKLYQWVRQCIHGGIKVHENTLHWVHLIETKELELQAYTALQPFRTPSKNPSYSTLVQQDLDWLIAESDRYPIDTINSIELKFHQVQGLNKNISDSRPIPWYKEGKPIELGFLEWYLSKRIQEWVAFGGEIAFDKGFLLALSYNKKAFHRAFYWDLWRDITNLRFEAEEVVKTTLFIQDLWKSYKGIPPERKESFDTQV